MLPKESRPSSQQSLVSCRTVRGKGNPVIAQRGLMSLSDTPQPVDLTGVPGGGKLV